MYLNSINSCITPPFVVPITFSIIEPSKVFGKGLLRDTTLARDGHLPYCYSVQMTKRDHGTLTVFASWPCLSRLIQGCLRYSGQLVPASNRPNTCPTCAPVTAPQSRHRPSHFVFSVATNLTCPIGVKAKRALTTDRRPEATCLALLFKTTARM